MWARGFPYERREEIPHAYQGTIFSFLMECYTTSPDTTECPEGHPIEMGVPKYFIEKGYKASTALNFLIIDN